MVLLPRLASAAAACAFGLRWVLAVRLDDEPVDEIAQPTEVKQAVITARNILEQPINKKRLADALVRIRASDGRQMQHRKFASAVHNILGNSLKPYGITDLTSPDILAEVKRLGKTDPEVGPWIRSMMALFTVDSHVVPPTGEKALHFTAAQAKKILDDANVLLELPQSRAQLREAMQQAASDKADPVKRLLPTVQDVIGNHLIKYGIDRSSFLSTFAHVRAWSVKEPELQEGVARLTKNLGGRVPDQAQIEAFKLKSGVEKTAPPLAVLERGKFSVNTAKAVLQETINSLRDPKNLHMLRTTMAESTGGRSQVATLVPLARTLLGKKINKLGIRDNEFLAVAMNIGRLASIDPAVGMKVNELVSLVSNK